MAGRTVFIWETADGQIAAVLNREGPGDVFLQTRPDLCTPELEEEMVSLAEERLDAKLSDGSRRLFIWAGAVDVLRQDILTRRGYRKDNWPEHQWRRHLEGLIPDVPLPTGFPSAPWVMG